MTVTDDARTDLHQHLRSSIGPEPAGTLMALLPPVGWADVATKQDLALLRAELRADMADLRAEMYRCLRSQLITMVTTNVGLVGLAVGTLRFL